MIRFCRIRSNLILLFIIWIYITYSILIPTFKLLLNLINWRLSWWHAVTWNLALPTLFKTISPLILIRTNNHGLNFMKVKRMHVFLFSHNSIYLRICVHLITIRSWVVLHLENRSVISNRKLGGNWIYRIQTLQRWLIINGRVAKVKLRRLRMTVVHHSIGQLAGGLWNSMVLRWLKRYLRWKPIMLLISFTCLITIINRNFSD